MTDHCAVQTFCLGLNEAFAVAWRCCHVKISVWLVVRWFVVLLRSYSVLQRPTTYYSSTTPTCYSVLQRTTPGLQSITPVLLCTTKYYSLLQSITPVLLCTTKYYSSSTPVLLQTCLSLSTVAWKCRQDSWQDSTLANANACKMQASPQSVLLLMHANLQHVSLSVLLLGNAGKLVQNVCFSVRLQMHRAQCFW